MRAGLPSMLRARPRRAGGAACAQRLLPAMWLRRVASGRREPRQGHWETDACLGGACARRLVSFSEGVSFEDLSKLPPLEQWAALPKEGKFQILLAIGIIEHQSEWKIKPHYMSP
eukprot:2863760-Prymnesium_polylepis.2